MEDFASDLAEWDEEKLYGEAGGQPLENEAMPIAFPALIVWPVQRISRSVGSGLKSQH
jgi:hypothetical protein